MDNAATPTPTPGQAVTLDSGLSVLTGTVARVSASSVWVTFDGTEYRFSLSQDGQYRRHGRTAVQSSPVLVFPTTWSVMANEAGNEAATTEVLYSGLTKAEAYSTARTLWEQYSEDGTTNYYIQKDAK